MLISIRNFNHQEMEDFLTEIYKNGYHDGEESVTRVEMEDVEKALLGIKGIGPVAWKKIRERLAELFKKGSQDSTRTNT